ncbi:MAG: hypothetical protein NDI82_03475 [Anaeromyxobacteraceae bacterium]|nr:hypothetical protein [Anaeromyxobacteraceae bacterium]
MIRSILAASVLALCLCTTDAARAQEAGPAPAPAGANPLSRLLLMPDVSAVASFAAAWNQDDLGAVSPRAGPVSPAGKPAFLFEELELGLQSVIDPYARASLFIAFSPEEVAVEEAFLTTTSLPWGLQVKAGRIFAPWGRVNVQHPHAWDFVDGPLARGRILAEEVLAGPGLDVAWLAPLPWFAELHLAAQGTAPGEGDEERLTGVVRLAQFFALGEETTLGVGLSAARRDEGPGAYRDLGGADVVLRWRPVAGREAVNLQGELFTRRFRGVPDAGGAEWGAYAQAFWRAGAHAGLGLRWDRAPSAGDAAPGAEQRVSGLATWFLSEFQRLRLQVSHERRPGGDDGWAAVAHLEFGIGAHGAHPF